MPDEERINDLERRIIELEMQNKARDYQLKLPLDIISQKIIKDTAENLQLARFENMESSVGAAFTLTPTRNYHRLSSDNVVYSSESTAVASGEYEGQILLLEGNSNANTVLIRDNANTALESDCTLRFNDIVFMVWDGTVWLELARNTQDDDDDIPRAGHIALFGNQYYSIDAGTWVGSWNDATYGFGGYWMNSTEANNDAFSFKIDIPAGTYTLVFWCKKNTDAPIVQFNLDTVEIASFDTYAGALSHENRLTQTGITISTGGIKTLQVKCNGKNADATSYCMGFQMLLLIKTA